jgi:hypothetical protein
MDRLVFFVCVFFSLKVSFGRVLSFLSGGDVEGGLLGIVYMPVVVALRPKVPGLQWLLR